MIEFASKQLTVSFDEHNGTLLKVSAPVGEANIPSKLWQIGSANAAYTIADASDFHYEIANDALQMHWTGDAFSVCVRICKYEDSLRWFINAELTGEDTLESVRFPILQGLRFKSKDSLLVGWQNGHVIEDPIGSFLREGHHIPMFVGRGDHAYINEYPAGISYQFSAYYGEDFGYYLATEDSDVYIKTYIYEYNKELNALDYSVDNYPENIGEAKKFNVPYPFVLELYKGSWVEPTLRYREWAIKQKWCTRKLSERALPKNLYDVDFWRINHTNYALGTRTQEFFDTTLMLRDVLGCRMGLHWYGWNKGQHDVNYPKYISPERIAENWPQELTAWNKRFTDEGIVKMPYLNLRLWDAASSTWEEYNAPSAAIVEADGSFTLEPWNNREFHPMCPTTEIWQNRCEEMAHEYIEECGFDGSYLDQIASFNAKLCFSKSHPHPVGGGTWWNDSYHKLLDRFRAVVGEQKILTTESCCETYVDFFDMFLTLDTNFQPAAFNRICQKIVSYSVPLFRMIYGGYAMTYGSICVFSNTPLQFEYNFMRNTLWGMIPSIDGGEMQELQSEKAPILFDIMKRGVGFYQKHKQMFFHGRLLGPAIVDDCEKIKIGWCLAKDTEDQIETLDGICAMRWEDTDGRQMILAYNFLDHDADVVIEGKCVTLKAKAFAEI
ncbi:MAG: hypothetical protein IIY04_01055 [Oscillospiraceae bacterium]|nr:hypothetical protein [Oscillospiraceae bacterium]